MFIKVPLYIFIILTKKIVIVSQIFNVKQLSKVQNKKLFATPPLQTCHRDMPNRAKKEQNCKKNCEHNKKEFKQVHLAKIFFNFYIFHTQTLAQHHNIQAYFFYCNKIIKKKNNTFNSIRQ